MGTFTEQVAARSSSVARRILANNLRLQLELAINATPNGEVRNRLAVAKIHLCQAIHEMARAEAVAQDESRANG